MRIGFAGLGRMGAPMAVNLSRAGFEVVVWNRSKSSTLRFAEQTSAAIARTPRELAEKSDIVVTMLADDDASQTVHLGNDGLFAAHEGAQTFIEMGTMSPDHLAGLRGAAEGKQVIDAPVSGATKAALDATLLIMAGAEKTTVAPLMPIFNALGKQTLCLGRAGNGSIMKLAINSIIHGLNQTVSEALTLAEVAGIPPSIAFDAIEASAACAPMLKYRRDLYLDETNQEVTFTVSLAKKDMMLATSLAEQFNLSVPQALLNLKMLEEAENQGFGSRDMASIVNFMRKER
jgi:3-hydroxyisobutyrate dehydrogenase-like beta-hydroxyacid dehydrogenase